MAIKANTSTAVNANLPGFRIILRGNKNGKPKRAVRTIHVASLDAAYDHLANNGDKLAKEVGFKVEFTNVFAPAPK